MQLLSLVLVSADVTGLYSYDYDIVKKKDGRDYMVPKNPQFVFKPKRLSMYLENLFNGDKFLGKISYFTSTSILVYSRIT